jgi:hypothetical protein
VIVVGRASASGWVSAPFVLGSSDGVFGRFDLAALRGCTPVMLFVYLLGLSLVWVVLLVGWLFFFL